MSIGNTKDNGGKGNDFAYHKAVTKLLSEIACATITPPAACCPTAATEATLLSVLTALQNGQDFEQSLVMDTGGAGCPGNCPTYFQIRTWDTVTHTFNPPVYYTAAGIVVVPVGPVTLVNPQYTLASLLVQDTAIGVSTASIDTKTPVLGQALAASSVPVVLTAIQLSALTPPAAITGFATSVKQSDGTQKTQVVDSTNTEVFTPITRTPTFTRASGAGLVTIPAGARSISFLNSGLANANVDGNVIKSGEQISMDAGAQRDILAAITYDPLTSELLIVKVV